MRNLIPKINQMFKSIKYASIIALYAIQTNAQTLSAPPALASSNITNTSVQLTWWSVSGAVNYNVYNGTTKVGSTTNGWTSFNVTGLSQGTNYTFTVKAFNSSNVEGAGSSINVLTTGTAPGGTATNLTAPSALGSNTITNNSINLTWWSVANAVNYNVYNGSTKLGSTTNGWTNFNVTGLNAGTSYTFTVKAFNISNQEGPGSNITVSTSGTTGGGGGTPPTNTGCMAVGANLTGDYQWTSDGTDGRVFNPNVANWSTVTDPWNPAFLADINGTGYKALRFMDWNSTNWSKQTTWATRTLKTANHLNYAQWAGTPIAYEWMIDLCNRTNKHMWVNVPHQADANYMTQLATLIKNNLNASLNVYVEYSNETWNGTFGDRDGMPGQYTYCIANSAGLPGSNETYRSQAFHTKKSCEVFKAFNDVFGSSKSRVKKVIATYGNEDVSRHMLEMLDNTSINPNGLRPDLFAIAPYIGSGRNGAASNAIQQFKDDVNTAAAAGGIVAKFKEKLTTYNNAHPNNKMLFICYEGGSHYFGAGENPKAFYENSGSYDAYLYMLNEWKKHFNLFMQFVHRDKVDEYSAWGAKKYYGEPNSTAHKYRAIADFISSNACGAPREESDEMETSTSSVLLVPNPASQKVTVSAEAGEVSIMNLNGTVLASKSSDGSSVEFDLTGFNAGIYLVKVGSKVAKLVVE